VVAGVLKVSLGSGHDVQAVSLGITCVGQAISFGCWHNVMAPFFGWLLIRISSEFESWNRNRITFGERNKQTGLGIQFDRWPMCEYECVTTSTIQNNTVTNDDVSLSIETGHFGQADSLGKEHAIAMLTFIVRLVMRFSAKIACWDRNIMALRECRISLVL